MLRALCLSLFVAGAAQADPPPAAPVPAASEAQVLRVIARDGSESWARRAYWDEYQLELRPQRPGVRLVRAQLVGWLGETVESSDELSILWEGTQLAQHRYERIGVKLTLATPMRLTLFAGDGGQHGGGVVGFSRPTRTPPRGERAQRLQAEIDRRAPPLPFAFDSPVSLSLFFPVTPGPKRLRLHFLDGEIAHTQEIELPAEFARLHLSTQQPMGRGRVRPE